MSKADLSPLKTNANAVDEDKKNSNNGSVFEHRPLFLNGVNPHKFL